MIKMGTSEPKVRSRWAQAALKRSFDVAVASLGLILLGPLLLLMALAIRWSSPGPALFRQRRMGRHFREFDIYKFRTMVWDVADQWPPLTAGNDPRITRVGRVLRKAKLDELPQLLNVLKGDMSLVGPRPEVPRYVEMFRDDYEQLLRVRPGITDPASVAYGAEEELLAEAEAPEEEYVRRILPDKIARARLYLDRSSFGLDVTVCLKTLGMLVRSTMWTGGCERPVGIPAAVERSVAAKSDQRREDAGLS